jgi:PAS domain S-box-containing protein
MKNHHPSNICEMTEPGRTKTLTNNFHDSRQFCYVLTDLHGLCIYGNPFFLQQCGFTTIDCEGFSFTQFLKEPEFEKHMALSNRILQSDGSPLIHEFQHGSEEIMPVTIRWEIRLLEIKEDGNGIIQYLGTVITPREKGRDTGITTVSDRERYEAYEMSDEAVWRLELEVPVSVEISSEQLISHIYQFGYIAECNDHMARMHGWERRSDLVGKKLEAIMSMEQTMQCDKMKSFTTNGFTLRNGEMETIDVNGRRLYFNINLKGIVEQGMLKRVWGTQHDITEKKKAEEERLRSELFYRNLIADSLDGILLTDTNGIITFASPSVEKILGYRP